MSGNEPYNTATVNIKRHHLYHCVIFILVLLIYLLGGGALKAQKRMIRGYVLDSATQEPIANAVVSNAESRKMVFAQTDGFFSISASINDLIFFNATGYRFDTVSLRRSLPDTIKVFLVSLPGELRGVTVTTKGYSQYQLDSMRRRTEFVSDVGGPQMKQFSGANSGAGIGLNLDALFKKKERSRKKAYQSFEKSEKNAYIDFRFSRELVTSYTGLHGDSLQRFMFQYTPSYEWLRKHPADEDILYYINAKLKLFFNR